MKNFKKILLRIITILTLIVFLTSVSFFTYNKKITKGAIFETIGLGAGALGALVAAYFATAGITFSGSADADGNFLGNYVSNWVKNSPSFSSNPYFNSSGEFIGSSDDLSIVQNNDTDAVSLIFGKEFAVWLEALKQSFVSYNHLSDTESTIHSVTNSFIGSFSCPVTTFNSLNNNLNLSYQPYSIMSLRDGSTFNLKINNDSGLNLSVSWSDSGSSYRVHVSSAKYGDLTGLSNSEIFFSVSKNDLDIYSIDSLCSLSIIRFNDVPRSLYLQPYKLSGNTYNTTGNRTQFYSSSTVDLYNETSSTLEGALTDGYQDFQDAINQDLTNADEEEVAVVDVGEFPETLDGTSILEGLLDKIIAGTLNPTYEGTRENMGEAEEEKEGERPFVPEVPEGWVVVDGLEDFFPFCIPWDLYNIIAVLNVPPEAPRFEYEISFGNESFEKEKVIIDLAPFNTVATIFRIMMAVGFVVFLIIKTRDLIRG